MPLPGTPGEGSQTMSVQILCYCSPSCAIGVLGSFGRCDDRLSGSAPKNPATFVKVDETFTLPRFVQTYCATTYFPARTYFPATKSGCSPPKLLRCQVFCQLIARPLTFNLHPSSPATWNRALPGATWVWALPTETFTLPSSLQICCFDIPKTKTAVSQNPQRSIFYSVV